MKKFVLDASFISTALLQPKSDTAEKLKKLLKQARGGKVLLYAPHLLVNEFASSLRFSKQNKEKIYALSEKIFLSYIKFEEHSPEQVKKIIKFSFRYNVSVYDASYHVLALTLDANFLTNDKKYFNKAKELGNIELIG